jgi:para-aminobenzoate synthetase component I
LNIAEFQQAFSEYALHKIPCIFLLDFELQRPLIFASNEVNPTELLFDFNGFNNCKDIPHLSDKIEFRKHTLDFALYQKAYRIVARNIQAGNSYLLNLSAPTHIETNLTLREIFYHSKAKYKILYKNEFVCFSPETFLQIHQNKVISFPMKGTIDATIPNAENIILRDKKETAEHYTIVDLIRNDLSMVAKKVRVEKFRFIDKIQTSDGKEILQVSSKIVGELYGDYLQNLPNLICKMLPAGSISGAPKKKTLEIIQKAEQIFKMNDIPYQRGYYTGICGYFDGENMDSGVMIRFIENSGNNLYFKSGGGITYLSEMKKEFEELNQKVYVPIVRNDTV